MNLYPLSFVQVAILLVLVAIADIFACVHVMREAIRRAGSSLPFMMRKDWMLGFLGFLGLLGYQGILGFLKGDWLQAIWILSFAFFTWFIYFLPVKK
jgi:hypothetical protein